MIALERLNLYLNVNRKLQGEFVDFGELLQLLDVIAPRDLRADLEALGVETESGRIHRLRFERAVRAYLDNYQTGTPELGRSAEMLFSAHTLRSLCRSDHFSESLEEVRVKEAGFEQVVRQGDVYLDCLKYLKEDSAPYSHQIRNVKRAVYRDKGNVLISDEVGIGKTLTAYLIFLELFASKLADSLLMIAKSPLVENVWLREFSRFFLEDMSIAVLNRSTLELFSPGSAGQRFIVSNYNAVRKPFKDLIRMEKWDCLIIDEAHHIRNLGIKLTDLCHSLNATYKFLLTATPIHNSGLDIYSQFNLIRPGILDHVFDFKELHLQPDGMVRSSKIVRQRIEHAFIRTRRSNTNLDFPTRGEPHLVQITKPAPAEDDIYERVVDIIQGPYLRNYPGAIELKRHGDLSTIPSYILQGILVLKELASHPVSALQTIEGSLRPAIESICRVINDYTDLQAIDVLLEKYANYQWGLGTHAKTDKLIEILPAMFGENSEQSRKVIIFAVYLKTQEVLRELLTTEVIARLENLDLFIVNGNLDSAGKSRVLEGFAKSPRQAVLLSTDVAGEGLNLQTADTVINFDFPWNPMKVEQRIGRIDRQVEGRDRIYVYSFLTRGTIEDYIHVILNRKLRIFRQIMGDFVPPITLHELDVVFDNRIGAIIATSKSKEEMQSRLRAMTDQLNGATLESIRKKKYYWERADEYR